MKELFSNSLRHFSLSIDIVNEEIWKTSLTLIEKYLSRLLNIYLIGLLKSRKVTDNTGLETIWSEKGELRTYELMKDGKYYGQVSYAFDKDAKLWIVAGTIENQVFLNDAKSFKNLWPDKEEELPDTFPCFDATHAKKIKTSIILPLKRRNGDKPWGVLNLESEDYLIPTNFDINELENIAKSISTLYHSYAVYKEMIDRSQKSLNKIDSLIQQSITEKQGKNKTKEKENAIFIAYAADAPDEVISIIRKAVNHFEDKIKPYFWKDLDHLGNTFDLIWEKINSCCLGICYFAEYADGKTNSNQENNTNPREFRYNPNVLVEAGMMQAISIIEKDDREEGLKTFKWLPIKESSMENIHYLYPQKAVMIERDKNGDICNPENISTSIKNHIANYIRQS